MYKNNCRKPKDLKPRWNGRKGYFGKGMYRKARRDAVDGGTI